jgi:phosphonate transport system substrate-binding protein
MPYDENGVEKQITEPRKRRALSPSIRICLATALAIALLVGSYHVIKGIYTNRLPAQFAPRQWVDLSPKSDTLTAAPETDKKPILHVAVAPIVSPEMSVTMYHDFVDYLARKLDRIPEPLYRLTYAETNDLVRYNQCDIAIVCTYPFIRGEREFGMQALVIPQVQSKTSYNSLIVVPRSSPASSLLDLRGKRFASGDIGSSTGWLYPAMRLMESGEDPNHFFGEHMITGSHDRSLRAVLNGYVDGAAIHSLVYDKMISESPDIAEKIKILEKSQPFGIPPIVGSRNMDPKLKNQIQSVLLEMHNDARGRAILNSLQIDRFVIPEKNHFDPLRQAVGELEGWR